MSQVVQKFASHDQLAQIYGHFLSGQVSTAHIVQASQWARTDPRLGQIVIDYLVNHWPCVNTYALKKALVHAPWPSAMGVIWSHVQCRVSAKERSEVKNITTYLMHGISKAQGELFFIGLYGLASKRQKDNVHGASRLYSSWGYYAAQPMVPMANVHFWIVSPECGCGAT